MKNLSSVDLNLLVAFDALLGERNVTRAARRIGLSQPALSKALNRLREIFDDPLFERRDGVMQPTARAEELGKPVRREAPGVEVVVRPSDRLRVHRQFANNELDFAVMPISESVTELRAEPLFAERPVTLMAKGHPLARKLPLDGFVAAGHVTVALEGQGVNWIDAALAARGLSRNIVMTLPSFVVAPFVVGATDLISTLPQRLVARLAPLAGIVAVPPPLPPSAVNIHLAWHPRSAASLLHIWLRAAIKSVARSL